MDVEAECVVLPHDVAEDLVIATVVRRVDDPLVLPVRPWMGAGGAEGEPERLDESGELDPALGDQCGTSANDSTRPVLISASEAISSPTRFGPAGVSRPRRPDVLEAIDEIEARRVEERELLLDGDREVVAGLEALARLPQELVGDTLLRHPWSERVVERRSTEGLQQAARDAGSSSSARRRPPARRPGAPPGPPAGATSSCRASGEVERVAAGEGCEVTEPRRVLLFEPCGHLGKTRMAGDERRASGRRGLGRDHAERLGEDRRDDAPVGEREQVGEVPVVERAREQHPPAAPAPAARRGSRRSRRPRLRASKPASASRRTCTPFCSISLPKYTTRCVAGEEAGEPVGVAVVGQPLARVAGVRQVSSRLVEQRLEGSARGSGTQSSMSTPGGISKHALDGPHDFLEDLRMCAEPTNVAPPAARVSAPRPTSAALPRIEYSSSEPCALTANGAPVAAPTGAAEQDVVAKTTSAGNWSRSTEAFASTQVSSSARVQSCSRRTW